MIGRGSRRPVRQPLNLAIRVLCVQLALKDAAKFIWTAAEERDLALMLPKLQREWQAAVISLVDSSKRLVSVERSTGIASGGA